MLSTQSVEISVNFSKSLFDKKINLEPFNNTALSELTATVNNVVSTNYKFNNYTDIIVCLTESSEGTFLNNKTGKTYALSSHDAFIDNYREKLSKLVAGYLRFARGVVVPEIKALHEKLTSDLNNYKFKEPEDFFNIVYFKLADVFSGALIDSEVAQLKGAAGYVVDYLGAGKLTTETLDVSVYLLTGLAEVDTQITGWINQIGANKVFSYIASEIKEYMLDTPETLDYSLANYLFYRNLAEKADLNIGYSVMQLRTKAANNRTAFGNKLYGALELYARTVRNKQLLTSNSSVKPAIQPFSDASFPITIYEESFKLLAENNCPIEALLGYISYEENYTIKADELIAKKDFYISKWENARSLYIIRLNSRRLDLFKNMLSSAFISTLSTGCDEELEARKNFANYDYLVNEKFSAYVKTLTAFSTEDISQVCLEAVAGVRFYYSNAYYILNNMQKLLSMHESMKPDEAALYSVIEYLVDFFMKQIKITKY